jgi:UDP-GlcNAc:undecaprenyl-phosphate GlcNAc-1-phosphate transferase
VVLPVLSAVVLLLGYLMERVTVKFVKKKVQKLPRVLENRPVHSIPAGKIRLDKQSIDSGRMNIN